MACRPFDGNVLSCYLRFAQRDTFGVDWTDNQCEFVGPRKLVMSVRLCQQFAAYGWMDMVSIKKVAL